MGFGGSKHKSREASKSFQQLIRLDIPPLSCTPQEQKMEIVPLR